MSTLNRLFKENPPNPGYCLVVRPMGDDFDRVWAEIGRAVEQTFAWTDVGALSGAGTIMDEVIREIARTDVVIVDVTEARPNVFYELGIAHATKGETKVVLLKQASSRVPFDVQAYRHLEYDPSAKGWLNALLPELERRVRQALEPTSWFRIHEGDTFRSQPMSGDHDEFYQFDVQALTFAGDPQFRNVAVRIAVTVRRYPSGETSPADRVVDTLSSGESRKIPNLPWRLKFESFDELDGKQKAVICVIPEGGT